MIVAEALVREADVTGSVTFPAVGKVSTQLDEGPGHRPHPRPDGLHLAIERETDAAIR